MGTEQSSLDFKLFQMQFLVSDDVLVLRLADMQRQLAMQRQCSLGATCLFVCLHHRKQRFAQ